MFRMIYNKGTFFKCLDYITRKTSADPNARRISRLNESQTVAGIRLIRAKLFFPRIRFVNTEQTEGLPAFLVPGGAHTRVRINCKRKSQYIDAQARKPYSWLGHSEVGSICIPGLRSPPCIHCGKQLFAFLALIRRRRYGTCVTAHFRLGTVWRVEKQWFMVKQQGPVGSIESTPNAAIKTKRRLVTNTFFVSAPFSSDFFFSSVGKKIGATTR